MKGQNRMKFIYRGYSLEAALNLQRRANAYRCRGLEPVAIVDEPGDDWPEWCAKLLSLKPHASVEASGWGGCFGAGLSPEEAVACCDQGLHRHRVIDYWDLPPEMVKRALSFEAPDAPYDNMKH